jgi:hypothetical protein
MFLSGKSSVLGEALAARAEQMDQDLEPDFNKRFGKSIALFPNP